MSGHGTRPYRRAGRHPGRDSAELIVLHARCTCYLAIAARAHQAICGYFEETALCRRSPGVTAIAPTGRPSPGARFAKGLFVLTARAVRDSVVRGAGGPACRYPGARSFALLPGRLLPFAGSGRSGFLVGPDHAFTL
jgi:hypothetical protein